MKRILPSTMIGTAVGCVIGAIGNVKCYVPHGGFVVLRLLTINYGLLLQL